MESNSGYLAETLRGLAEAIEGLDETEMSLDELAEGLPFLIYVANLIEDARLTMVSEFDRRSSSILRFGSSGDGVEAAVDMDHLTCGHGCPVGEEDAHHAAHWVGVGGIPVER